MIPERVIIPNFRLSQVNKASDGYIIPHAEVLRSNMMANIEAFDSHYPIPENALFLCVREKMDDGDYRYGMAAIPVDNYRCDLLEVFLHGFEKFPHIVITFKRDVGNVIRRVLKNLAFS